MDYESLEKIVKTSELNVKIIGKSHLNKNIYALNKIYDKNFGWVLITGGIHAREHLSCDVVCFFISLLKDYPFLNYNISFVPLVNPDGADIVIHGISDLDEKTQKKLLKINKSEDFCLYKSNARGVDLNNNFDGGWERKFTNNTYPSSQGYYGEKPFSEKESRALANWTKKIKPFLTLSYHLKGEEIYFDYFQNKNDYLKDLSVANIFAKSTGYKIKSTQKFSSGGYKDWCVQKMHITSLTIELGDDKFSHPYPQSELKNICFKNKNIYEDITKVYSLKIKYID